MKEKTELNVIPKISNESFDSNNHFSVIFRKHGSIWPHVFPYCIFNAVLTYVIIYLKDKQDIDLTFPSNGHTFMATLLSFLIVTRSEVVYGRYMTSRAHLEDIYRMTREIVQYTCILTMRESTPRTRQWRSDVAFYSILLLRATMVSLEHESSAKNAWDIPELDKVDKDGMRRSPVKSSCVDGLDFLSRRSTREENFRVPVFLALQLRKTIVSHKNGFLTKPMVVNEERAILDCVVKYMSSFHGIRQIMSTPYPFPLLQMTRTFLFLWVFSLPFALSHDITNPIQNCLIMFVITFGFLGLEYVSMELDDPFGDDPVDFDDMGMAEIAFEDIYTTISKCDGQDDALLLRKRIKDISVIKYNSINSPEPRQLKY